MTTSASLLLADRLIAFVVDQVARLARAYLPDWRIPGVFAGHRVGQDVRADVAFTLGLLHGCGCKAIDGIPVSEAISRVLRLVAPTGMSPFGVYRIAETLNRFGPFTGNELLTGWSTAEYASLEASCDTREALSLLEAGKLTRNYVAVLARCELARSKLGLTTDNALLSGLVERTAAMLDTGVYFDDSRTGGARFDIYSADIYLFSEPLAPLIRQRWERGARTVVELVQKTVASNGAAFPWGRSSGALAACLSLELGALALRDHLTREPGRWLTLMAIALDHLPGWFSASGLTTAHQNRSPYAYRGPHRRLQMTFDCLGKLAWSAMVLRQFQGHVVESVSGREAFPPQDELLWLDENKHAALWCYRSPHLAFVLPMLGPTLSDYLPSPRNPGVFEVPVDSHLPSGTPLIFSGDQCFVGGHLPAAVVKTPHGLHLEYADFPLAGQGDVTAATPRLGGRRTVSYRVEQRTLEVSEHLRFDHAPDAITLQLAEAARRPLSVAFTAPVAGATARIVTSGLKEYRSFWGELPIVHQLDLDPEKDVRFDYKLRPLLRVMGTGGQHPYHAMIYRPMAGQVALSTISEVALGGDWQRLRKVLDSVDIFHLHWPEWLFIEPDLAPHRRFIDALAAARVRVLWTQHNLSPHNKDQRYHPIYNAWASAADAVVHHSVWGMDCAVRRLPYRPDAIHRVIPHPHFGPLVPLDDPSARARTEEEMGLTSGRLRLGIFGAPRVEKQVMSSIEAFIACDRPDLELFVTSLRPEEPLPVHPRVVARRREYVSREVYDRWLKTVDVVLLPFEGAGMLSTGLVGDVIGHGVAALVSDWGYLRESLGAAGIPYGTTAADLTNCLRLLNRETVARAADAACAVRESCDPVHVSRLTFALLETLGTSKL